MSQFPPKPAPKAVYVKSYGCQMNVYDSQRMADVMGAEGYREVATPEEADLILLNTCHIRERAAEKVYSELGRMRVLKEEAKAPGARCWSASPAASPRPRARRSSAGPASSISWSVRRAITACPISSRAPP